MYVSRFDAFVARAKFRVARVVERLYILSGETPSVEFRAYIRRSQDEDERREAEALARVLALTPLPSHPRVLRVSGQPNRTPLRDALRGAGWGEEAAID